MSQNVFKNFYPNHVAQVKSLKSHLIMVLVTAQRASNMDVAPWCNKHGISRRTGGRIMRGEMTGITVDTLLECCSKVGLDLNMHFDPANHINPLLVSMEKAQ